METITAVLEQLREVDGKFDVPVRIMYDIVMPMIAAGHSRDQIANALVYLKSKRQIELFPAVVSE